MNLRTLSLVSGVGIVPLGLNSISQPKTEKGEHKRNVAETTASLAALGVITAATVKGVKNNPKLANKYFTKAGRGIEQGVAYVTNNAPKLVNKIRLSKAFQNVTIAANNVLNKVKSSKITQNITNSNLFNKLSSKVTQDAKKLVNTVATKVKPLLNKASNSVTKFNALSTAKKGKFALVAVAAGLLAYAATKGIANYLKKEGAIGQKYDTLRDEYELMLASGHPITDARTGQPISFDDYCKAAQTMLK